MASETPCISDINVPYLPRRYTTNELLVMQHTLPYVCFPTESFRREVWWEEILTEEMKVIIDANRLRFGTYGKQVLKFQQIRDESLETPITGKGPLMDEIPPNSNTLPTISVPPVITETTSGPASATDAGDGNQGGQGPVKKDAWSHRAGWRENIATQSKKEGNGHVTDNVMRSRAVESWRKAS